MGSDLYESYKLDRRDISLDSGTQHQRFCENDSERPFWIPLGNVVEIGNFCVIRNSSAISADIKVDVSGHFESILSDNSALVSVSGTRAAVFRDVLLKMNKVFVTREA